MSLKGKIITILWNKLAFSSAFLMVKISFLHGLVLHLMDYFPPTCPPKLQAIEKYSFSCVHISHIYSVHLVIL